MNRGVTVVAVDIGVETISISITVTGDITPSAVIIDAVSTPLRSAGIGEGILVVTIGPPGQRVYVTITIFIAFWARGVDTITVLVDTVSTDLGQTRVPPSVIGAGQLTLYVDPNTVLFIFDTISIDIIAIEPFINEAVTVLVLPVARDLEGNVGVDRRVTIVAVRSDRISLPFVKAITIPVEIGPLWTEAIAIPISSDETVRIIRVFEAVTILVDAISTEFLCPGIARGIRVVAVLCRWRTVCVTITALGITLETILVDTIIAPALPRVLVTV
jgi:hypothetical protein